MLRWSVEKVDCHLYINESSIDAIAEEFSQEDDALDFSLQSYNQQDCIHFLGGLRNANSLTEP